MPLRKEDMDALLAQARALPGAQFDIKWETRRVLSLESKMFALFNNDTVMYKVADDDFLVLSGLPGVRPAPYLARARWIEVSSLEALSLEQLHDGLADARRLVLAKLPKAVRQRYEANA